MKLFLNKNVKQYKKMKITTLNGQMFINDQLVTRFYHLNGDVTEGTVQSFTQVANLLIVNGIQVIKVRLKDGVKIEFQGANSDNNVTISSNNNVVIQGTNKSNISVNQVNFGSGDNIAGDKITTISHINIANFK